MKIKFILILLNFIVCKSFCQQILTTKISFNPVFGKMSFVLSSNSYLLYKSDSIIFETLKFYISHVQLLNNGAVVYSENNSFHLIDVSLDSTMNLTLKMDSQLSFNEIKFNLGIDSMTNVSGVMGGDLDPTKGMYWTWQSGYINFKLEGRSSACKKPGNEFEFHLGGYHAPFNTLQKIDLKITERGSVKIYFDLEKYFNSIDIAKQNQVMSPNDDAVKFSSVLASCFYTK